MDYPTARETLIGHGYDPSVVKGALTEAEHFGRTILGTWAVNAAGGKFHICRAAEQPEQRGTRTDQFVTDLATTRAAIAALAFQLGNGQANILPSQAADLTAAAVQTERSLAGLREILRALS